jgi:hypothetical protein
VTSPALRPLRQWAWPAGITAVVLLTWPFARFPLAGAGPYAALLVRPPSYVILTPLSNVLDALTLLSVPQLIAFGVSLIAWYIVWRVLRWRISGTNAWCEFCVGVRALLLLILTVLLAAVLPRPMARLVMRNPDDLVFDIHSHTNFSHDARSSFTVADNRAWHRAAGFDVAYVTDHRCFDGAAEGLRTNPKRAGDGTVLLSGIELPPDESHLIVLEPPDAAAPDALFDPWCVRATAGRKLSTWPVRIQTIPETFTRLRLALAGSDTSVIGIEMSDGSPRGIAQAQRDRIEILGYAHKYHLALVAGSDNHGWGRTAVAWSVMRIPGWRALSPDSLGATIEMKFRRERDLASHVIERRTVYEPAAPSDWVLMAPEVALNMGVTITPWERVSWIAWVWAIALLASMVPRREWKK